MLSGRAAYGNQNPYWGYSPLVGAVVPYAAPTPAPTCWKEPYERLTIVANGANQRFNVASLAAYPSVCDTLLSLNGAFFDAYDSRFTSDSYITNFMVNAYLSIGDDLAFQPITNSLQPYWLSEFYWTVPANGAGQIYSDPTLSPYYGARNLGNTNISNNGVTLIPGQDYSWNGAAIVFNSYLQQGDVIGILPTCGKSYPNTPEIDNIVFSASSSGANKTFTNLFLANYTAANQAIVTLNGFTLDPQLEFTLSGPVLTIIPYINSGDNIVVLANSRPC